MTKVVSLLILILMGSQDANSMAVHDPTNFIRQAEILRQATEQVNKATEQIQKLDDQLKQMKETHEQGQRHYDALTGNKNFGELHHNPKLQQFLPQEWQGLYQATQHHISALKGLIESVKNEEKLMGSVEDMQKHIEGRMAQFAVTNKAVGLHAYQGLQERMKQVDHLMGAIKNTNDPKSIAELQARIAIEQAHIQNETAKLQLVSQLQRAEQQLIEQQKYQMSRRILDPKNTVMPGIR